MAAWVALAVAALGTFAWARVLRPRRLAERPFEVEEVVEEAERIWTVRLRTPPGTPPADHLPGQFHFVRPLGSALPAEEHHFTISSSPTRTDVLESTVKGIGDFTVRVPELRPGDRVAVDGAWGRFSYVLHPRAARTVFLAGGIGITPVMAMLRHMRDTAFDGSVLLVWGNRSRSAAPFVEELERMQRDDHLDLTVVHVLSRPEEDWKGPTGHVDLALVKRHLGMDAASCRFYVCGPPPMLHGLVGELLSGGVPPHRIHAEVFRLLKGGAPPTCRGVVHRLLVAGLVAGIPLLAVLVAAARTF